MNKSRMQTNSSKLISPRYIPMQVKLIFDNQRQSKLNSFAPKASTMIPKNNQAFVSPKIPTLQRYSSEIEIGHHYPTQRIKISQQKKLGNVPSFFHKKASSQIQGMNSLNKKQFFSIQSSATLQKKVLNQNGSLNLGKINISSDSTSRKLFRPWNAQKISQLKETSQTSTLQNSNPCLSKCPSFVKTRSCQKLSFKAKGDFSLDNFNIIRKLGSGKFGKVLLVRQKKTGLFMAMKVCQKKKIVQSNYLEQFINQLKIQAFLDHPSIIKLYGFFSDEVNFYTLMELGCDGQLYKLIKNNKTLTQRTTSFIIRQLLSAVDFLHQNNILHRDIKPQNIVLIYGTIKLCDFGWASYNKKDQLRSTYCGTPLYLSPQMLKGSSYDQKVDVWAIGIMAYQLKVGCSPFNIKNSRQLYKIVTQPLTFPLKDCSTIFKQFITRALEKYPQQRLNSKDLLKLEFIKKYQNEEVFQQLSNNRFNYKC